jgi:fumarylpyruvate hydrolase
MATRVHPHGRFPGRWLAFHERVATNTGGESPTALGDLVVITLLFDPPAQPTIEIVGRSDRWPVRRIFCVGRNYVEHAKELGNEVDREAPFYFLKDASAIVANDSTIPYAAGTSDFHHEIEFVVAIGATAQDIPADAAMEVVYGYALGLDLTRRDLQNQAKAKKRPWDFSKNFERSAPITGIVPRAAFGEIGDREIRLDVSGVRRQSEKLSEMVWSVPELISHLSRFYRLEPGDLLFTGTPAGVGPLVSGDVAVGRVEGLPELRLTIA